MFLRKPLRYEFNSLEPFIDEETMFEHYDKHYKKYTDKFNEAIQELPLNERHNALKIIKNYSNITEIRNNGGGYINHMIYFENISPFLYSYSYASDQLKKLIDTDFGSYERFYNLFKEAGNKLFGSGWVWLILHNGKLKIAITKNQDNPIMSVDCNVLLGMDVWEHAYYLKHKSNKSSYIEDFFKIIDWKIVSNRL
jgi:Fe-Mn family superoxide dismutase